MISTIETVFSTLFSQGALEGRNGIIDNREELDEILERFKRGMDVYGVKVPYVEIVARACEVR